VQGRTDPHRRDKAVGAGEAENRLGTELVTRTQARFHVFVVGIHRAVVVEVTAPAGVSPESP
jgi:hypothetical protein